MAKSYTAAARPPMGWNSWDCYGAGVTEEILMANARYMRERLAAHGWEYVVCDIQWYEPTAFSCNYHNFAPLCMDGLSRLLPAENRFPSAKDGKGFRDIADRIHGMGLKFGIHMMRGVPRQAVHAHTPIACEGKTAADIAAAYSLCPWNTDMYGVDPSKEGAFEYYLSVFELYASWGVDYVKIDDICNTEFKKDDPYSAKKELELIRRAMDCCGREMVLSLSPGPAQIEHAFHLSQHADLWRLTGDFWDEWDKLREMFTVCERWYPHVGRGGWPDCDMLPLGLLRVGTDEEKYTRFTRDEQRMMMTLWCVFRSPLMFGGDMTRNDAFTESLLTNDDVLGLCIDSTGNRPLVSESDRAVWTCLDGSGRRVLAFFNLSDRAQEIYPPYESAGLDETRAYAITDLWTGATDATNTPPASLNLPAHSTILLRFEEQ